MSVENPEAYSVDALREELGKTTRENEELKAKMEKMDSDMKALQETINDLKKLVEELK
jgi:peptidoglycan hydrolase CwlO-like protein